MASKKEFRGYIQTELNRLVRALSAIKNGDRSLAFPQIPVQQLPHMSG